MVKLKKPTLPTRAKKVARGEDDTAAVSEQAQWTGRQDLTSKGIKVGLYAAIGSGVVALGLVLTGFSAAPPVVSKAKTENTINTAEQAAAEDLAKSFVVSWLGARRGEERSLAPYIRTDALRLPTDAAYVASEPSIASVEEIAAPKKPGAAATSGSGAPVADNQDTYTVTVSASVRGLYEAPEAATRRFFAVPVVITDTGARAATIPAPVPAPATGPDVNLGYRYRVSSDHPTAISVQQFLAALTSGVGEISRYITPGTDLRAITPPPYKGVKILDLASDRDFTSERSGAAPAEGTKVRVLATAEMSLTPTQATTAQYPLTLTARGGRWEVSALDPLPLLPAGDTATQTPTATTPSASGSTTAPAPTSPAK